MKFQGRTSPRRSSGREGADLGFLQQRSSYISSAVLGFLFIFGTFNRITFPTFVFAPLLYLLPHFSRK